ncbi:methyltransferase [Emticicia sp. SJ17W-69]|uniref:methyltransferase n=1 Tax=Emticicia sp. SJ17W-69 TaxID=3421657 RepID=UPI003EBB1E4A
MQNYDFLCDIPNTVYNGFIKKFQNFLIVFNKDLVVLQKNKVFMLNDQYWSERYENHQTRWDIGKVAPALKAYFDQLTDKNLAILIPGCGNSHEAIYLLQQGFTNITLIDISAVLVNILQKKLQFYVEKGNVRVLHQDFFEHSGNYDLIIEQTFFCAIDQSLRTIYAEKMSNLLNPKGKLVGLLFDCHFEGGPPFGGSKEEYIPYFEPYFKLKIFEKCYNSIPPRAGNELFICLENLEMIE